MRVVGRAASYSLSGLCMNISSSVIHAVQLSLRPGTRKQSQNDDFLVSTEKHMLILPLEGKVSIL